MIKQPPGDPRRKAKGWTVEIARMLGEGYSVRLIQQALATAGVTVGASTVQREIKKLRAAPPARGRAPDRAAMPPPLTPMTPQQEAQAFMARHTTNPLLKPKGNTR